VAVRPDSPGGLVSERGRTSARLIIELDKDQPVGGVTVRVRGQLDLATVPVLEHRLESLLSDGVRLVVLDVGGVSFCDVPALNLLLRAQCRLWSQGGQLRVYRPCRSLRLMVAVLGLADCLPLMLPTSADGAGEDGAEAG
jgi:anti-sigma B factor antagonist